MFKLKSTSKTPLSDQEFINRFVETGDSTHLGPLFKRYQALVFGTCMKYLKNQEDSEDAVMEVFENLVNILPNYQVTNFKGWLHKVVVNHCLKVRKQKERNRLQERNSSFLLDNVVEMRPEDALDNIRRGEDEITTLTRALSKLNNGQRECLTLFYLEQKSYKEIASTTPYSLSQVKSYIQNGKRNLKNVLPKM